MEVEKVKRVIRDICDETKKRSLTGLRAHYTDDVVFMPPGEAFQKGQDAEDAIKEYVETAGGFQFQDEVIKVTGSAAIVHANYIMYGQAGEVLQKGKLMSIMEKNESTGEWQVSHEMWN